MYPLLTYLVSSLVIVTASGAGSSADVPCCPYGASIVNGRCALYESPGEYFVCESDDVFISSERICVDSYPAIEGTPCKDGYVMENICIKRYDARPDICPQGYLLNSQRMCEKIVDSTCPSTEPSPMHPYDPLPLSPSITPCLLICPTRNETFISSTGSYSNWLQSQFVNGSCYYNVPIGSYAGCDGKGEYHPETNSCWYYTYTADGNCEPGYEPANYNGNMICLHQTEAMFVPCPPDYKVVEYQGQRMCAKKVDAVCVESTMSPSPSQTVRVVERTMSPSNTLKVAERSMSPSQTVRVVERSMSSSHTPKIAERSESPSQTPKVVEHSESPSMTVRVVERSMSSSQTPKIAERSESPSQTPKVVERSESPSMTVRVVERSMSSSQTPKVAERSESPSQTPKVVEHSESPSMTVRVVERSMSSSQTPKVAEPSMSPSQTPKVAERSESPSQTPKVAERTMSSSMTPKVAERSESPSQTPKVAERTMSSSMTPKVAERSESPSQTPKVAERTSSPSVRPSNVDVLDYTNRPNEPLYTRKPDCNIWVCPDKYELTNINGKVMCKYYKSADYNQITLPDGPEGQTGGFYNDYYCPTGTKLVVIQGAVESKKYWCEGYTDARWLACPTNSPLIRTPIYKSPLLTHGPSRKPLFYQGSIKFNGAVADALADPRIIKKLIIGISCAVNDMTSSIKIKSICKKGPIRVCLTVPVVQTEDAIIDCDKMYPSSSPIPSPVYFRQLQGVDAAVEVIYEYQPADDSFVPSSVRLDDSPVLKEVALDVSLTNESSTMVAYSMTSAPAGATSDPAASSLSAASRNAIIGIVIGCVALGAILIGGLVTNRSIKRGRREKLMAPNVTKNPATDVTRWAFAPQTV